MVNLLRHAGRSAGKVSRDLSDEAIAEIRKTRAGRRWLAAQEEMKRCLAEHAAFDKMIESGVYVDPKTGKTAKLVDMSDHCCLKVVVSSSKPFSWYESLIVQLYTRMFGPNAKLTMNVLRALRKR